MRKIFMTLMALGIVGAFAVGPAAASHTTPTHSDFGTYESGSLGTGDLGGLCLNEADPEPEPDLPLDQCVNSNPAAGDEFVNITVSDASGAAVYATAGQDLDGDGAIDTAIVDFCGSIADHQIVDVHPLTGDPVPITVFVWTAGTVTDTTCLGPATGGTVAFDYFAAV